MSDLADKPAVILFAHGSLLCGSSGALEAHAGRMRRSGDYSMVEVGFLNYSIPTFEHAVSACYNAGKRKVLVLPFFLVPGYFVTKGLPEAISRVSELYPEMEFQVAAAIGFDEALADAIIDSALSPLSQDAWRDDLATASRSCRANPDCPLYGTPSCPRVPEAGTPIRIAVE